jgi:hypothetical protein
VPGPFRRNPETYALLKSWQDMRLARARIEIEPAIALATDSCSIQIDLWVSTEQLDQMLAWCHRAFDRRDWDYHTHSDPLLGKNAVVTRFYFAKQADASAFIERWRR